MSTEILRCTAVERATGLSRTTLWRLERAGQFPPRRQISANAVGWIRSEVEDWIAARSPAVPLNSKGGKRD